MHRLIKHHIPTMALLCILFFSAAAAGQSSVPSAHTKPVLLVHGLGADSSSWGALPELLRDEGFTVYVLDYNDWDHLPVVYHTSRIFEDMIVPLARQLEVIVRETGSNRINIIAHSLGGVVVRAYIAGWGGVVEGASEYNEDIRRVIYISSPHFGLDVGSAAFLQALEQTDYGRYLGAGQVTRMLDYLNDELTDLSAWFIEEGGGTGIQQLTVSIRNDDLVGEGSASLNGENIAISGPASAADRHVYLKNYAHGPVEAERSGLPSIIDVQDRNHPLIKLAKGFFNGDDSWEKVSAKPPKGGATLVLDLQPSSTFSSKKLGRKAVKLHRVKDNGRKQRVRVRMTDEGVFYAEDVSSGQHLLTIKQKSGKDQFPISVAVADGATRVFAFDPYPDSADDDPDDDPQPDDPPLTGDIPERVNDLASLRAFVSARFSAEAAVFMSADALLDLVVRVRDDLVASYPDIETLNDQQARFGYTAPPSRHRDALYIVGSDSVIDFVLKSKQGGILFDKLQWARVGAPWNVR